MACLSSSQEKYLTKTERKYFDALSRFDTIKNAATELGIDPQALYNWIYNMKKKYKKRRGWVNAVLSQRQRNNLIREALTEKKPLEKPDDIEEE